MSYVVYQGSRYELREDESVLDALVRGGAELAFSCRRGSCHTCTLRAVEGSPGDDAQRGLRPDLAGSGHFLPCIAKPKGPLIVEPPDPTRLFVDARVGCLTRLSTRVVRIGLEPEIALRYRPGQYVNLRRGDGITRSYSTRGFVDEDYFLELDVQRRPEGALSPWLHDVVEVGDVVQIQGPLGSCHYDESMRGRRLLLAGTGTGIAPLRGVVLDALRSGHDAPIDLYFGARRAEELYAHQELEALRARGIRYHAIVLEGAPPPGHRRGHLAELVFRDHPDVGDAYLFLAGDPELVRELRSAAVLAGAARADVRADPFDSEPGSTPRDAEILESIGPDPELWEALAEGPGLRAILEDFYTLVYEDPRLAPFFHGVTKERAVSKQYEFLVDLLTGSRRFFGLKPFNAHHWMVVSDELFDHREALFESVLRRHGLPDAMRRRWAWLHELFRREIVKTKARGLVVDGIERKHEGFSEEELAVASLCDGCGGEMPPGSRGRMHLRTGRLYCDACGAESA